MKRTISLKTTAIHIIVWICFIAYEITVAVVMGTTASVLDFAVFYALDIALFYFNAEFVFRYASGLQRVALVMVPLIFIEITLFSICSLVTGLLAYKAQTGSSYNDIINDDIVRAIWRGIYIIGLSTGYWFFKRTIAVTRVANQLKILQLEAERSKVEVEKDLAIAQNAFLRSQINPHFLFNTLNYVYNSVEKVSPDTAEGILLLSEIMRYALSETEADGKALLHDEIAHIEQYIALTQLRFNNELSVDVEIDIDDECMECRIPPLVLITYVENIFKHGDLTKSDDRAKINIKCKKNELYLFTKNAKRAGMRASGTRIGLVNASIRLSHFYTADAFELSLTDNTTHFIVDLKINLWN